MKSMGLLIALIMPHLPKKNVVKSLKRRKLKQKNKRPGSYCPGWLPDGLKREDRELDAIENEDEENKEGKITSVSIGQLTLTFE
jgi:hypothetical protein